MIGPVVNFDRLPDESRPRVFILAQTLVQNGTAGGTLTPDRVGGILSDKIAHKPENVDRSSAVRIFSETLHVCSKAAAIGICPACTAQFMVSKRHAASQQLSVNS